MFFKIHFCSLTPGVSELTISHFWHQPFPRFKAPLQTTNYKVNRRRWWWWQPSCWLCRFWLLPLGRTTRSRSSRLSRTPCRSRSEYERFGSSEKYIKTCNGHSRFRIYRISPIFASTVKPVYNGHPLNLKKWPFDRGALIKVRFRLINYNGGCWQMVVVQRWSLRQVWLYFQMQV